MNNLFTIFRAMVIGWFIQFTPDNTPLRSGVVCVPCWNDKRYNYFTTFVLPVPAPVLVRANCPVWDEPTHAEAYDAIMFINGRVEDAFTCSWCEEVINLFDVLNDEELFKKYMGTTNVFNYDGVTKKSGWSAEDKAQDFIEQGWAHEHLTER